MENIKIETEIAITYFSDNYFTYCTTNTITQHCQRIRRLIQRTNVIVSEIRQNGNITILLNAIKNMEGSPLTRRSYLQSLKAVIKDEIELKKEIEYFIKSEKNTYDNKEDKFTAPELLHVIRNKIQTKWRIGSAECVIGLLYTEWPLRDDLALLKYVSIWDALFLTDKIKINEYIPSYNFIFFDDQMIANIVICRSKTVPKHHRPIRKPMSLEFTRCIKLFIHDTNLKFNENVFSKYTTSLRLYKKVKDVFLNAGINAEDIGINYMRRAHRANALKSGRFDVIEETAQLSFHKLEKSFDYNVNPNKI
jgi:hypothetical protein